MSRVGEGQNLPTLQRGGGAVAPCPLFLRPCMIHYIDIHTYILYVKTLLSVSVIRLHFPHTSEPANTRACFLGVLTFLPQSPQSVPRNQTPPPTQVLPAEQVQIAGANVLGMGKRDNHLVLIYRYLTHLYINSGQWYLWHVPSTFATVTYTHANVFFVFLPGGISKKWRHIVSANCDFDREPLPCLYNVLDLGDRKNSSRES